MNRTLKRITTCIITFVLLLWGLTSCIDGDQAKQTIEDFLTAIETENYTAAESYLHPDRPSDLQQYFETVEDAESIDFQSDIEILRYVSVRSAYYDTAVDGSIYETTLNAKIGDKTVSITVEIVENDTGYGIYDFTIDF